MTARLGSVWPGGRCDPWQRRRTILPVALSTPTGPIAANTFNGSWPPQRCHVAWHSSTIAPQAIFKFSSLPGDLSRVHPWRLALPRHRTASRWCDSCRPGHVSPCRCEPVVSASSPRVRCQILCLLGLFVRVAGERPKESLLPRTGLTFVRLLGRFSTSSDCVFRPKFFYGRVCRLSS